MADPLETVWDALEAQGWEPRGPMHRFYANCPAHEGDSHQLKVVEGVDGRALLYCHTRHCEVRDIAAALGLRLHDLFPPGHHRARPLPMPTPKERAGRVVRKLDKLLTLLDEVGEEWRAMVVMDCQYCGHPSTAVWLHWDGLVDIDCPGGCNRKIYMQGLAGRVEMVRAGKGAEWRPQRV